MLTLQIAAGGLRRLSLARVRHGGRTTRVVIIDGGLTETATALRRASKTARRERGIATLEVELLVVTHIDNDHILGIIELLKAESPGLHVKDIWFNGRPQLDGLARGRRAAAAAGTRKTSAAAPADLMGGPNDAGRALDDEPTSLRAALPSAADLLGPQQGDQLSKLLAEARTCPGTSTRCGMVGR